jgi:hypothetical protein
VAEGVQFAEVAYEAEISAHIVFKDKPQEIQPWSQSWYTRGQVEGTAPSKLGNLIALSALAGRSEPKEREADLKATYVGQVSMRIIKGKVESVDFERLQVLEFLEDDGDETT